MPNPLSRYSPVPDDDKISLTESGEGRMPFLIPGRTFYELHGKEKPPIGG
jgi:hypothetical protein